MTVCIAAICDSGKAAVVGADRMITAAMNMVEREHTESKIEKITESCIIMAAGDWLYAFELAEKLRSKVVDAKKPRTIKEIAEELRDLMIQSHLDRIERVILKPRNLNWEAWNKDGAARITPEVYKLIDGQIFSFGLGQGTPNNPEFLIAGTDATGAHISRVFYGGMAGGDWMQLLDNAGSAAIGAGGLHAVISLAIAEHDKKNDRNRTLYDVYCAKKRAEMAQGVGKTHDFMVIADGKIEIFEDSALNKLEEYRVKYERMGPTKEELESAK